MTDNRPDLAAMDDMRDPDVARALRLEDLDQRASNETLLDDPRVALGAVVDWWEHLPNDLRQDIEGSGRMPGCIARAKRLAAGHPDAALISSAPEESQ